MKLSYYILILLFVFSCKKKIVKQEDNSGVKSEFSIPKKFKKNIPVKGVFKTEVETWKELNNLDVFFKRFEDISINEALSSATDLSELVTSLKDSVIPNKFDKASFKARVNVFHNETLRLADLSTIEDVTINEVNLQIEKVITSYSALNTKINSILEQEKLESLIDLDLEKVVLSNTKLDDNAKKSSKKKKLIILDQKKKK